MKDTKRNETDYHIISFDTLDSTNRYAAEHADMLNDRDIITAEIQTAGRGRFDRVWISDIPDNISLTIVLKPSGVPHHLPIANMTQYAAVCIARLLRQYGQTPAIKWPNDVKVGGKKISGILTRTVFAGMNLKAVAVGIGINVNLSQPLLDKLSQPATSFSILCGRHIDRDKLRTKLLDMFFAEYETFMMRGFSYIRDEYISQCCSLHQSLTVHTISGDESGFAADIDENGALVLMTADGTKYLTEGES